MAASNKGGLSSVVARPGPMGNGKPQQFVVQGTPLGGGQSTTNAPGMFPGQSTTAQPRPFYPPQPTALPNYTPQPQTTGFAPRPQDQMFTTTQQQQFPQMLQHPSAMQWNGMMPISRGLFGSF